MRFQWYLVDTTEQTVQGCNDVEQLNAFLDNPEFVILSAQHGIFFNGSRDQQEVEELDSEDMSDPDESEEEDEYDDEESESEDDPQEVDLSAKARPKVGDTESEDDDDEEPSDFENSTW